MDQPRPFFIYFWSFQTNNTISQQTNVKNVTSIQYTILYTAVYSAVYGTVLGAEFEPMTSLTWVVSHNHYTRAPLKFLTFHS